MGGLQWLKIWVRLALEQDPLWVQEVDFGDGTVGYATDGTPVDCVRFAALGLVEGFEAELIVSGINHGSNLGDDITYSGTVAAALEGRARVVGVEPERIPTLERALHEGGPVAVDVSGVAADSLGATRLGDIAFSVASRTGVLPVLVSDEAIVEARRFLWSEYRLVVEHVFVFV